MADGRSWAIAPVAVSAFLIFAATPVSALGDVSAEAVHVEEASHEGAALLLWNAGLDQVSEVNILIEAARLTGMEFEQRFISGPTTPEAAGQRSFQLDVPVPDSDERPVSGEDVSLVLAAFDPNFQSGIHMLGGASMKLDLASDAARTHAQEGATMDAAGIGEYEEPPDDESDRAAFNTVPVDRSVVVTEVGEGSVRYVLEGDFTLEAMGLDFALNSTEGTDQVRSTTRNEPVEEGASLQYEVSGFLRLHFTDARLVFEAPHHAGLLQFAAQHETTRPTTGQATLVQATGSMETPEGTLDMEEESFTPVQVQSMYLGAAGSTLQVDITFQEEDGFLLSLARVMPEILPTNVLMFFVGSLGFLAAVFAAASLASPSMGTVEGALERGQYRRAARLAGKIRKYRPDETGADVAHAIALTKAGDNKEAIRAAEAAIAKYDPPDGVLHYVLGLAYMNEGQRKEAAARFVVAVRKTPNLRPDVDRMLPGAVGATPYGFV